MDVTSLFLINKVTFYNVAPFFHSNEKYNISNCSSGYLVFSQAVVKLLYTSTHVQQINNWTQLLFTVPWGGAWSALSSPHKFTSRAKQKRSNRRDSGVKGCVRSSWHALLQHQHSQHLRFLRSGVKACKALQRCSFRQHRKCFWAINIG